MENKILEETNKRNIEKYGPIQECCEMFESFCRCYIHDYMSENSHKHQGGLPIEISEKLRIEKDK